MILDPIQQLLVHYPWALPILGLCSMLLSMFAPMLAGRWPWLAKPLDVLIHVLPAWPGRSDATAKAARAARTPPPLPLSLLCLVLALLGAGCTPGEKQAAKTVLDVGQAVCTETTQQVSTEWVELVCSAIDVADGTAHVFLVHMRPVDAAVMKAKQ